MKKASASSGATRSGYERKPSNPRGRHLRNSRRVRDMGGKRRKGYSSLKLRRGKRLYSTNELDGPYAFDDFPADLYQRAYMT